MPCPYHEIVGTRHCRVLRLDHSDANGIDMIRQLAFRGRILALILISKGISNCQFNFYD